MCPALQRAVGDNLVPISILETGQLFTKQPLCQLVVPEAVYDLLADLQSHLEWAGTRQTRDFHLPIQVWRGRKDRLNG
jgi:hypothetical protein